VSISYLLTTLITDPPQLGLGVWQFRQAQDHHDKAASLDHKLHADALEKDSTLHEEALYKDKKLHEEGIRLEKLHHHTELKKAIQTFEEGLRQQYDPPPHALCLASSSCTFLRSPLSPTPPHPPPGLCHLLRSYLYPPPPHSQTHSMGSGLLSIPEGARP
jgi:hypothetical protein